MGTTILRFKRMPSLASYLPRAMIARRPSRLKDGETVPRIEAHIARVTAEPARVRKYAEVCGFATGDTMPLTYPHVLAAPLHMAMLTSQAFPIRLLGLVHVANSITQHVAIPADAELEIECRMEGHRDTKRGQEFEMHTTAQLNGADAWVETSRFLARARGAAKGGGKNKQASPPVKENGKAIISSWHIEADMGRRYAAVSGDYNPIHLSAPTARLFGFRRAIAHGMWSLARSAAELIGNEPPDNAVLDVQFKLPLLMPAWVTLHAEKSGSGTQFELLDAQGEKPHLSGTLKR